MAFLYTKYIHKSSIIHSLNPVVKFSWMILVVAIFLSSSSFYLLLFVNLCILLLALMARIFREFVKGLLFMVIPIFLFSLLIHGLFNPLGTDKSMFSQQGIFIALFWGVKITSLIGIFYLFILTTYPGRMVASLRSFGLPYKLGFLINSTLQTIPAMLMEAETIIDAQKARGLETSGNFINKLKAYVPLIGPVILGSVMRVYEKTIALEVRGFGLKTKKTSYYIDNPSKFDKFLVFVSFSLLIIYITLKVMGWQL